MSGRLSRLTRLAVVMLVALSPLRAEAQTGNCAYHLYFPSLQNAVSGVGGAAGIAPGCATTINVDFNGDGYEDLAIGVPDEDLAGQTNAGMVHLMHGTPSGLYPDANDAWSLDTTNVLGVPDAGDEFGLGLGAGDFNGDGYTDLAVGAPGKTVGTFAGAGGVWVFDGSPSGLVATNHDIWTQASPDVPGVEEAGDGFGYTLIVGDFNGDGFADLAIGAPFEAVGSAASAGAVNVLYGSAQGLTSAGSQIWTQDSDQVLGEPVEDDRFGYVLAAGDLDGNGYDDLAIGVPQDDTAAATDAGAVNVLYGSASGLSSTNNQLWSQDTPGVQGVPEASDHFGYALAIGDFEHDGRNDLAVGVPNEASGATASVGAVHVIRGSAAGLTASQNQLWLQGQDNLDGVAEANDLFGYSLHSSDFNADGYDDLAVGVPGEDTALSNVGEVNVLYGGPGSLSSANDNRWFQDNIGSTAEVADDFGIALTGGDYDGNGFADLVVGVPGEQINAADNAGGANVIYGTSLGLTATGAAFWHQESLNVSDSAEASDHMGLSLR